MNTPVIELEGLTKDYGSVKAVDNLSLTIHKGEIFGLLGPNGAGKTTTILMMLGLADPTAGRVTVCNINATHNPIAVKKKVGYMPDNVGFYDNMTALENILYIARLNGTPEPMVKERAAQVMELVGLGSEMHKKTSAYSRGMKQRLGLADVLIRDPEIIILDEPTLGIDPEGVREFLSLIRNLSREQSLTVLLSSHHLHQVQQVCDRVGIFVNGKMLVQGSIESLARHLFGEEGFTVLVTTRDKITEPWQPMDIFRADSRIRSVTLKENTIAFTCTEDITHIIVRLLVENNQDITGVQQKEWGLDEIYQRYFENNLKKNVSDGKSTGFFQKSFFKRKHRQFEQ